MSVLFLILGLTVLAVPLAGRFILGRDQTELIRDYQKKIGGAPDTYSELQKARAYNRELFELSCSGWADQEKRKQLEERYDTLLNISGNGMMGYLEIPAIHVDLPIFHGTQEQTLKKGAGHLQNSSLPVGGTSTHVILAGHTGLPEGRMFDDLVKLKQGDVLILHVLDQELHYTVRQISIVLPEEAGQLQIVPGEDRCTLMTCYPYGINTHRLVISAFREENAAEGNTPEKEDNANETNGKLQTAVDLARVPVVVFVDHGEQSPGRGV